MVEGTKRPFVSVIIPVYNDPDGLSKCLKALARQSYPAGRFEVQVVDNGSQEPLVETEEIRGLQARFLSEAQRGSYAARNTGIKNANGEILAFTDSDCIPDPHWLENGVKALEESGNMSFIGGEIQMIFPGRGRPTSFDVYDKVFAFPQRFYVEEERFSVTANLITTRAALEKAGPFDASLFSGGDAEWGRRATSRGIRPVFRPDVIVQHPTRSTYKAHAAKIRRTRRGMQVLEEDATTSVSRKRSLAPRLARKAVFPIAVTRQIWSPSTKITLLDRVRASYAASVLNMVFLLTDIQLALSSRQDRRRSH
jgi:glycosyltransferase involved in cell wall biosynthesis